MTKMRLLAALAALVSMFSSLVLGQERRNADVVLITVDTLRADYVGAYGGTVATAALDQLATDGVLFESAYCQVPLTPPSHASILTGLYPATHGLRDFTSGALNPELPTLATLLKKKGYQTAAFVSALVLDRSWGLHRGFDTYFDQFEAAAFEGVNPGNVQRRADETMDAVLRWLAERDRSQPFFLWVHLFDPHHDYDPPEPFRTRYAGDRYGGEVAFADSQIARLLASLRDQGVYSSSLIVATSDHGEGLGRHQELEHGFFLYEESVRIPLILKLPDRYQVAGQRIETLAQTIDLLPTIFQILRQQTPPELRLEGRGLLSAILGKQQSRGFAYAETLYPLTTFGWSSLKLYREGVHKLIQAPRPELFNLETDPLEQQNLAETQSALTHRLTEKLRQLEASFGSPSDSAPPSIPAADLQQLASLGYVALGQALPVQDEADLADPKDRIGVYQEVLRGLQAAEAGEPEKSNSILAAVARQHPDLFIVRYSMGSNYVKLRQPAAALRQLDAARKLNPQFVQIDLQRAQAMTQSGNFDGARRILEEIAARPDAPPKAAQQLAFLYSSQGQFGEAIRVYRSLLQKRPDDTQSALYLGIALVKNKEWVAGLGQLDALQDAGAGNALIANFRGIALANLGRGQEAVASYRRATQLNPAYPEPRLNLALTLLRLGQKEEAISEYRALCTIDRALCSRYSGHFN